MMEHVADEERAVAGVFKPEYDVAGRVPGRRDNVQMFVEPVRPSDEVGPPALDDRQHAFPEGAQFNRLGLVRIGLALTEILDTRLGDDLPHLQDFPAPCSLPPPRL